ncbi:MAG: hypothetical protein MHM6MM_000751 [Cercozoa sp. M6MM]
MVIRKLRADFDVSIAKAGVREKNAASAALLVSLAPVRVFNVDEVASLRSFLRRGGRLLLFGADHELCNVVVNKLLQDISEHGAVPRLSQQSVVRAAYARGHYHPKECLVQNALCLADANISLADSFDTCLQWARRRLKRLARLSNTGNDSEQIMPPQEDAKQLQLLYPYGVSVQLPRNDRNCLTVPVLTSGKLSLPAHQCVAATCIEGKGSVTVCGSVSCMEDEFVGQHDNLAFVLALFLWLLQHHDRSLFSSPLWQKRNLVPDVGSLSERLYACLNAPCQVDTLPSIGVFDESLFRFDCTLLPQVLRASKKLGIKTTDELTLVKPRFEASLPRTKLEHFAPLFPQPPLPSLQLFDLDEEMSDAKQRLASLAYSSGEDVDYFVTSAADLTGLYSNWIAERPENKEAIIPDMLIYMLQRTLKWKSLDSLTV